MTSTSRLLSGLTAGCLCLVSLAACSGASDPNSPVASMTASAPAGDSGGAAGGSTAAGSSDSEGGENNVDCSGMSCSVTLTGDGQVNVLGNTIRLGAVENGRATLGVGDKSVSCAQGEEVSAGPLTLRCTTVTPDSVTLTASLG
jgi:hypothetical protein